MQNKYTLLVTTILLFICFKGSGQYNSVWAFGSGAGIDFNANPPKAIKTNIVSYEGCSSICDNDGQLLFYTNGYSVWNRNHQFMPRGKELLETGNIVWSTSQGALIIPVPGNIFQYYIFSMGQWADSYPELSSYGRLYYSLVDMRLNDGLGDVLPDSRGILLDSLLTESMAAVSGSNCNIWLLAVSRRDTALKAYNIDFDGIDPDPVVSSILEAAGHQVLGRGIMQCTHIGVAPNGNRLATSIYPGHLVLYDFDRGLGSVSNPIVLDTSVFTGLCFSPDNTKLYVGTTIQFDLSLNNVDLIIASKTRVGLYTHGADRVQRGPDGKIYGDGGDRRNAFLDVINEPNLAGIACQWVSEGFPLHPSSSVALGMPNFPIINRKIYNSKESDTIYCADSFLLSASYQSGINYIWEDGSKGAVRYVDSSGIYCLTYQVSTPQQCNEYIDTFVITFLPRRIIHTLTTFNGICKADSFFMQADDLTGSDYIWEDGTEGAYRKVNQTGTYWVSYQIDSLCENHIDSFIVTYPEKDDEVSFLSDTLVCENDLIQFENTSDPHFNSFNWLFGNGDSSVLKNPRYSYTGSGNYEVRLIGKIDDICPDTAYRKITVDPLLFSGFITKPDSICIGEGISFSHEMKSATINSLQWQFGDGLELSAKDNRVQHAYDIAGVMPVTLSAQFRACPDTAYTDTVYVFDLPKVDLGANSSICLNGAPVYLKNLRPEAEGILHYLWNTGAETETLPVTHPGVYSLTVSSEPLGCSATESVEVTKDCYMDIPNAFTPDGDGANDYFFPRQLLSKSITQFRMQVFNRWGQLVFETDSLAGRGWDGKFNGKEQPQGVYIYSIVAEIDGETEHYNGNVTLIR